MLFVWNDKPILELMAKLDSELEDLSDHLYRNKAYRQRGGRGVIWKEEAAAAGLDPAIDFMLPQDASIEEKLRHMLAEIKTINRRLK